jgi:hypothetical protein
MLTKWKSNKSRTRIVITQYSPGRRKVLGVIRKNAAGNSGSAAFFVAARPLTAAALDSVLAIMAG